MNEIETISTVDETGQPIQIEVLYLHGRPPDTRPVYGPEREPYSLGKDLRGITRRIWKQLAEETGDPTWSRFASGGA